MGPGFVWASGVCLFGQHFNPLHSAPDNRDYVFAFAPSPRRRRRRRRP